ncbi:hypothetical protein B0T11DRAFT_273717 [Plectosphaerella cucumerina]|uniref:Uncharacterized protein n=1 Tax=Plectosphaerella cucumerina TaxID=40658 RepID=A0A8K0XAT2_9PEZI|nr:hypothetical protein B0T11DRAFT_273717 [Plectosphaerella cucumerina]
MTMRGRDCTRVIEAQLSNLSYHCLSSSRRLWFGRDLLDFSIRLFKVGAITLTNCGLLHFLYQAISDINDPGVLMRALSLDDGNITRHSLYHDAELQTDSQIGSIAPDVSACFCRHGVVDSPGIEHELDLDNPQNGFCKKYSGPALFIIEIEGPRGTDFLSKNKLKDQFKALLLIFREMKSSAHFAEQHEDDEGESRAHFVLGALFTRVHERLAEEVCAASEAHCNKRNLTVIRAVGEHLEGHEDQTESWTQRKQIFIRNRGM